MFSNNINKIYSSIASVKFDTLMWIIWGSFAAIFAALLFAEFLVPKIKRAQKRPFMALVNAYAALTLAAFLTGEGLGQSVLAAILFWCVGYVCYGILCFFTESPRIKAVQSQVAVSSMPVQPQRTVSAAVRTEVPVAKSSVRLEHAISVTDKLLQKNLGKGDRQELEKLKNTLAVLQMKGTLTPSESDILNDNFNALLKLMAKYNV